MAKIVRFAERNQLQEYIFSASLHVSELPVRFSVPSGDNSSDAGDSAVGDEIQTEDVSVPFIERPHVRVCKKIYCVH